jgi:hypothetical protein
MRTFPFGNIVAVCLDLVTAMLPVAVKLPELGSYSSAVATLNPPAMRTLPLGNNVAVC